MDCHNSEAREAQQAGGSSQLVEDLAHTISDQMEFRTQQAVQDTLQKGAQQLQQLQQSSAEQRTGLEQQVEAVTEAQRAAEQDSASLHSTVSTLVQKLEAALPPDQALQAPGMSAMVNAEAAATDLPAAMPAPPCDEPWRIPMAAPPGLIGTPPSRFAAGYAYGNSPGESSAAASSPSKEELVREVTSAVKEHIHRNTETAIDALWQKGEKVFNKLHQEQTAHMARLQSQVVQCTEAQQRIHQDNAQLRRTLEALVLRLQNQFGPSAPLRPESRPFYPAQATPPPSPCDAAAAQARAWATQPQPTWQGQADPTAGDGCTPPATPHGFAPPGAPQAVDDGAGQAEQEWVPRSTVCITLRRADDVALGLDLEGETGGSFLCVRGLRAGGAVESWNRLNHGSDRDIRPGDRIIKVNDAEEVDAMLDNCRQRLLLKLSVQRGSYVSIAAAGP